MDLHSQFPHMDGSYPEKEYIYSCKRKKKKTCIQPKYKQINYSKLIYLKLFDSSHCLTLFRAKTVQSGQI